MSGTFTPTEEEERVKAELIADIEAAFDGVSREGGVSLHEAGVIDDYGSDTDRAQARLRDAEVRWQDVPEDDLWQEMSEHTFLDPIGFRYYLPAFLIQVLKHFRKTIPYNHDWMIYAFTHTAPEIEPQVDLLNRDQREVVSRFLDFFVRFDPDGEHADTAFARIALDNGWDKYLPNPNPFDA
jgi:hypothetical protein